jgi:hypothetical protein
MGSYEEWTQTNEEDARARESEDTRTDFPHPLLRFLGITFSTRTPWVIYTESG